MRPGLGPERQSPLRGRDQIGIEAVGTADEEYQPTHAAVAQDPDFVSEGARRPGLAALVTGNDVAVGEVKAQRLGLGDLARLAALDLGNLDRPKPQRPPRSRGAVDVELHQLGFGRAGQATNGDDSDLHRSLTTRSEAVRRSEPR